MVHARRIAARQLRQCDPAASAAAMAKTQTRPPGRNLSSLRMIWSFASRYPGRILGASLALLVAAAATSGIPFAFKLIIDKGFATGGDMRDIGRWFEYLLLLAGVMAIATAVRYY